MKKAFKLQLKSGDTIEIHMTDSNCELSIDDKPSFSINFDGSELKITKLNDSNDEILSSEEIEYQSTKRGVEPLRKCINCQGRTYCITNGCANTPCGWICD